MCRAWRITPGADRRRRSSHPRRPPRTATPCPVAPVARSCPTARVPSPRRTRRIVPRVARRGSRRGCSAVRRARRRPWWCIPRPATSFPATIRRPRRDVTASVTAVGTRRASSRSRVMLRRGSRRSRRRPARPTCRVAGRIHAPKRDRPPMPDCARTTPSRVDAATGAGEWVSMVTAPRSDDDARDRSFIHASSRTGTRRHHAGSLPIPGTSRPSQVEPNATPTGPADRTPGPGSRLVSRPMGPRVGRVLAGPCP